MIDKSHLKTYWTMLQSMLLLIVMVLPVIGVQAQVAQDDSLALVAIYQATDGANWSDNTNWLAAPVAQWFGVEVTANRVTLLDLNANRLAGEIPVEIGDLTGLTILRLGSNQGLTGEIPVEISNLTDLTELILWFSDLTGEIPPELGNLTNLTFLNLWTNNLTGEIPPELGNLTNLTFLNLDDNDLTGGVPPELGNLTNLTFLSFSRNELAGEVPEELGNLRLLQDLRFWSNRISGALPLSLTNLSLDSFFFANPGICVPSDDAFIDWLEAIPYSIPNFSIGVPAFAICVSTATEALAALPSAYTVHPNYPNPFHLQTTIRYGLPQTASVRIEVFDAMGRRVRVLDEGGQAPGWHEVIFDASTLPNGVYFYQLQADSFRETGQMLLVN